MSFINFLNYKKYFGKNTDAQAARIGHVNALYDELRGPIEKVTWTAGPNQVNLKHKRVLFSIRLTTIAGLGNAYFLFHPDITPDSIININLVKLSEEAGAPPLVAAGYQVSLVANSVISGRANLTYITSVVVQPQDIVDFYIEIINP